MTKRDQPDRTRMPRFVPDADGRLVAHYPVHRFRFLLAGGDTLDVWAVRDDSDLRLAVLEHTRATAIAGVTMIEATEEPT